MSSTTATNVVVRTWPIATYFETEKTGVFPLQGQIPSQSSTVTASAVPDANLRIQIVDIGNASGSVTLTFPTNMNNYVNKEFTFVTLTPTAGRNLVVACGAAQMIVGGQAAKKTTATSTDASLAATITVQVLSSSLLVVKSSSNLTFA